MHGREGEGPAHPGRAERRAARDLPPARRDRRPVRSEVPEAGPHGTRGADRGTGLRADAARALPPRARRRDRGGRVARRGSHRGRGGGRLRMALLGRRRGAGWRVPGGLPRSERILPGRRSAGNAGGRDPDGGRRRAPRWRGSRHPRLFRWPVRGPVRPDGGPLGHDGAHRLHPRLSRTGRRARTARGARRRPRDGRGRGPRSRPAALRVAGRPSPGRPGTAQVPRDGRIPGRNRRGRLHRGGHRRRSDPCLLAPARCASRRRDHDGRPERRLSRLPQHLPRLPRPRPGARGRRRARTLRAAHANRNRFRGGGDRPRCRRGGDGRHYRRKPPRASSGGAGRRRQGAQPARACPAPAPGGGERRGAAPSPLVPAGRVLRTGAEPPLAGASPKGRRG